MSGLVLGWLFFAVNAATPGPSTLAIMRISLAHGRAAGLRFAAGVVCGSVFWGLAAALGVAALLEAAGWALSALKIAGGLYLLWLAHRSLRSALAADPAGPPLCPAARRFWRLGLGLHLTNPKAVFGWTAIAAIALPEGAGIAQIAVLLGGCALLALLINLGYAVAFSAPPLARAYRSARRSVEGGLAVLFAGAGIGLLAWRR